MSWRQGAHRIRTGRRPLRPGAAVAGLLACLVGWPEARQSAPAFDVVVRGGTVLDGTGDAPLAADVGIARGRVVEIGDLAGRRGVVELDARGLMVAPGFLNLHSHSSPGALPAAVNLLTQGVTTDFLNPDGGGPLDVGAQLDGLGAAGLAVNAGAYIGFNRIWSGVVGASERRAAPDEIARMRELVAANLARGAWGVSAGLDYKPAYYATTAEVVAVVEAARPWRTNFTNHDRVTPESGYSSHAGMAETIAIGEAAGLVPVITHMKVQGAEQGSAARALALMRDAAARGRYAAADVYPYLAGQTQLAALLVPGWAQDGGRPALVERLRDPVQRARIVSEIEEAMQARFGGPGGVFVLSSRRELTDLMREMNAGAGETVARILERESPSAILRFGLEADLIEILRHPAAAIACDCGASVNWRGHPRELGTYPRVLGRYVRDEGVLTWEEAIRRMTSLPAAIVGLVDRGVLAPGMAADLVVFDPATIRDHATYEEPGKLSEGVRHVVVNGRVALRDGAPTGERAGAPLRRTAAMVSRPADTAGSRRLAAAGRVTGAAADGTGRAPAFDLSIDAAQAAGDRGASGRLRLAGAGGDVWEAARFGVAQRHGAWGSVTAILRHGATGAERWAVVIVDPDDPAAAGRGTLSIEIEGLGWLTGPLSAAGGGH